MAAFSMSNPSACGAGAGAWSGGDAPRFRVSPGEPDAVFILRIKEQQFMDAINTALAIDFQAIAAVPGPVVPGQRVNVEATLTSRGSIEIDVAEMTLTAAAGGPDWQLPASTFGRARLTANEIARHSFAADVLAGARLSRPYFDRASIAEPRYTLTELPSPVPRRRVLSARALHGRRRARRDHRARPAPRAASAVRRGAARADDRAGRSGQRVAACGDRAARRGAEATRCPRRAAQQRRRRQQRPADAAAAGRLDLVAFSRAVHLHARR